jgi:3D (Asp-Asp-Asp) domain-containing protein
MAKVFHNMTMGTVLAMGLGLGFALPLLTLAENPSSPEARLPPSSGVRRSPTIRYFIATAHSVEGTGASGKWSHPGSVAADRNALPLNSRIRIYGAGRYSGDYTVEDTGGKVDGRHLDIYMPSRAEAKKFGRKRVKVVVLKYGDDGASPPDPQQKAEANAVTKTCAQKRIRRRGNDRSGPSDSDSPPKRSRPIRRLVDGSGMPTLLKCHVSVTSAS